MAFPSFAGFPPCVVCAASYAKNDAIGFKRDNAQLTMCSALSVKHGKGFCAVFKVQGVPLTARVWQTHYARSIFFPFDYKGRMLALRVWGLCGAYGRGLALLACLVCRFPPLLAIVGRACLSYLPGRRAPALCRVSAPAGHGHSIREQRKKCIVF